MYIELKPLNNSKFCIKDQYDIIKISYACQQLIKEKKLDIQNPIKKLNVRIPSEHGLMNSISLPKSNAS